MDPVGSWSAYYNHGPATLPPAAPAFTPPAAGFLSPPPTYDPPLFTPLFPQKPSYAPHRGLRQPEEPCQEWTQVGQLPSPFGVLPHEAVSPNSFSFPNQPFEKRRLSPPLKPDPFYQNPYPDTAFQKIDYNSKLYPNGFQFDTQNSKEYRFPLNSQYPRIEKDRNFLPEKPDLLKEKDFEMVRREPDCQSSPISFAIMDSQRTYPDPKRQFLQTGQNFRYAGGMGSPESEYQRSKSTESYSSTSSVGDCSSQRPTPAENNIPIQPIYNPPVISSQPNMCYKQLNNLPPPLDVTLPRPFSPPRNEKNYDNRFSDVPYIKQWEERQRKISPVEVQNRMPHQDIPNHLPVLQDLSSCRGDPMSLVKNLQHNLPDKNFADKQKSKKMEKNTESEYCTRIPPPAHHNGSQNCYLDFDRWNLTPTSGKILTAQVSFGAQPRIVPHSEAQSLVVSSPVPYFPAFQLAPPAANTSEKVQVRPNLHLPSIEQELSHLDSREEPLKNFFALNSKDGFLEDFSKFIQGGKDEPCWRATRKTTWSKPCSFPKVDSLSQNNCSQEATGDPDDDPRYYPLPKSSDMRSFDSSDDSSDDGFFPFFKKDENVVQSQQKQKNRFSPISNKRKTPQTERFTQTPARTAEMKITGSNFTGIGVKMEASKILKKPFKLEAPFAANNSVQVRFPDKSLEAERRGISNIENGISFGRTVNQSNNTLKPLAGNTMLNQEDVCKFKVGDFIVHKNDRGVLYPTLWRVKDKNIIQKYQIFVKDGVCLYNCLPCVMPFRAEIRGLYLLVDAKASAGKSPLSNSAFVKSWPFEPSEQEKEMMEKYMDEMNHLQKSFDVYIQTLFSQALDSNFLKEIYNENDEYFVRHLTAVSAVDEGHARRLFSLLSWPSASLEPISRLPSYRVVRAPAGHHCPCTAPASINLAFHGSPYHRLTLHKLHDLAPITKLSVLKEVSVCNACLPVCCLAHEASHRKLALLVRCEGRLTNASSVPDPPDSSQLLRQLLADRPFLSDLFREVRLSWNRIEKTLREVQAKPNSSN